MFDTKGQGLITAREVRIALTALDFEISKEEAENLTESTNIDFKEFLHIIDLKINEADS